MRIYSFAMRSIQNFASYEKMLEGSLPAEVKSRFKGFASDFQDATQYAKKNGLDYDVILASENGEFFPRVIIPGAEGSIDIKMDDERFWDRKKLISSIRKFEEENDLEKSIISDRHQGPEILQTFFWAHTSDLAKLQREVEEFIPEENAFYKLLMDSGFKRLEAKNKSQGIFISHPLLIDGWFSNGRYSKGKLSISPKGPIRYMGPLSLTTIIKPGKGFNNERDFEESIRNAADAIVNKVLSMIGLSRPEINEIKKAGIENVIRDFNQIIADNISIDLLDRILLGTTEDKEIEDLQKVFGPNILADVVLRKKARDLII